MRYEGIIVSHIGNVRKNNEDNAYLNGFYREDDNISKWKYHDESNDNLIAAVFDGMGGEEKGELASRIAAKVMKEEFSQKLPQKINQYVMRVSREIVFQAGKSNMGTTFAGITITNNIVRFMNIGDSRGYLFRNNELIQMSKDHNMVQGLLSQGILTKEQAERHPDRNSIYQYLGLKDEGEIVELETYFAEDIEAYEKDIYLLCSDGLTSMVSEDQINRILKKNGEIPKKTMNLVKEALENGGRDNVTVILIECKP